MLNKGTQNRFFSLSFTHNFFLNMHEINKKVRLLWEKWSIRDCKGCLQVQVADKLY